MIKKRNIWLSVFWVCCGLHHALKAQRKIISYIKQYTYAFWATTNEDRQPSIRPAPATASQGLKYMIILLWLHLSAYLWFSGLQHAVAPKKNCSLENSSQAVPNPLNAINPAFAHSTSLSLYFSTFLHGEAWLIWLSRTGDRKVGGLGKVFGSIA